MTTEIKRPIVFDVSHLVSRLLVRAPSGIDRVDIMYGRYLAGEMPRLAGATHYALRNPNLLSPTHAQAIVRRAETFWLEHRDSGDDPKLAPIRQWLREDRGKRPPVAEQIDEMPAAEWRKRYAATWRYRLTFEFGGRVPRDALYLNVAQYLFEHPIFFRWLDFRPDVAKVFFVHDLLPLDYPEFFRGGYRDRFGRRFATIARHASALIVASEAVAARTREEFRRIGAAVVPIHVAPLPPPVLDPAAIDRPASMSTMISTAMVDRPYFITVGTIEPRKNHLLLLNVWRELARGPKPVPRLLIVGSRGWENEQVIDMVERSPVLEPYVLEANGLSSAALRDLIAGARALLMPSFDEGFGLPIIEALTLGTSVIASDTPVFREVARGCATLVNPIDAMGWLAAIRAAASGDRDAANCGRRYHPETTEGYFEDVSTFLASL